jgi:hypothetical protein
MGSAAAAGLASRFFFKLDLAPLFDELGGGKGGGHGSVSTNKMEIYYYYSAMLA